MSFNEDTQIRLTYLEDLVNKMNLVMAEQGEQLHDMSLTIKALKKRVSELETMQEGTVGSAGGGAMANELFGGPSEIPPDGSNR